MHRKLFLAVLVCLFLISSLTCAFGQSNLSSFSCKKRLIIAQANVGDTDDRAFWDSVKDSRNSDELKAYLEQFPNGVFAPLAKARLKALEKGSTETYTGKAAVSDVNGPKEIGRDGRFIAYDNETVLDTRTNLMWAAKDNGSKIEWAIAYRYCKNYRGGGYKDWRLPTQEELSSLYDSSAKGNNGYSLTPLITLSDNTAWASETRGEEAAVFVFGFALGRRPYVPTFWDKHVRALPVRSTR